MNDLTREEQRVAVTAFIAAIVEGVRIFGTKGIPEDALYESVASASSRSAFDMIIKELIEQKTFKREHGLLKYCGPI